MKIEEEILKAKDADKIVYGGKQALQYIKEGKAKMIIIAENCEQDIKNDINHYASIANIPVNVYKDSKEIGIFCGKPFTISALAILK